ncbi:DUF11 domain-containing protein [Tahibacter soli]|uniref:DUF11 domain-containing protein n=1 Tax=Tahibacter soli TaxID=2983605 RepID=A0A9X4BJS1_9GAMM|nr:DUF11 domain-containing protein [Tahibacter soli]MDC8012449.1 DUF11 domain-containing protein [Tahibacter soli]
MNRVNLYRVARLLCAAGIAGTWPVAAVQRNDDTATGTTGLNAASTKTYPSGLTVTYAVTGNNVDLTDNLATMASAPGTASTMFAPNLPLGTRGIRLTAGDVACRFANDALEARCPAGTLTVTFSRPVTDPVLHFGANGSQSVVGTRIISGRAVHVLSGANAAGVSLAMPGGAVNLDTPDGVTLDVANPRYNGSDCATFQQPITQPAGCGSVRVRGTLTSVAFDVALAGVRNVAGLRADVAADAYVVTATVDEDFGDAPASYDEGAAASHVVGGLRLGAAIDAENATVFNDPAAPVAPGPNAVAAGANNNGAAGDGLDDDGLATVPPLHAGLIGRTYTLTSAIAGAAAPGTLCGWIDFDRDGRFGTGERACATFAAGAATAALDWTVPAAFASGRTYARLRVSHDGNGVRNPTGRVDSGEVEDYMIETRPAVRAIKALHPADDAGRFSLSIGGTAFATGVGDAGDTGFRTVYHRADTGAPDILVPGDIATTPVAVPVAETQDTPGGVYVSGHACVDGTGATVASGAGTSARVTLPASVTGAAANGRAQSVTCTFVNRLASMAVTKQTPTRVVDAPGAITYTIGVTNTGAAALTGVNLVDTLPDGRRGATTFLSGDVNGDGVLDTGETWIYRADYVATQADIDAGANLVNRVAVTTAQIATPQVATATTAVARRPSLAVTKTTPVGTVGAPGVIPYTITVTNTGNVALTNVVPLDTLPDGSVGAVTFESGDTDGDRELDLGETWTWRASYAATQRDIDAGATLVNTVSATAAQVPTPVTATAATTVARRPSLAVAKTTPVDAVDAPRQIPYTIAVTNTGNVALTNVVPLDTLPGGGVGTVTFVSGDTDGDRELDLGETWTYAANYTATQRDIDNGEALVNTVSVTATQVPVPVSATATTGIVRRPSLAVTKTTPVDVVGAPRVIPYTITVQNTGNVALTDVRLVDTLPDGSAGTVTRLSGDTNADERLDVGETWIYGASYRATQRDIKTGSTLINRVAVTSAQTPLPVAAEAATAARAGPALAVDKTTPTTRIGAPGTIEYAIVLINAGNVALSGIALVDTMPDGSLGDVAFVSGDTDGDRELDVDETWIWRASYEATQRDILAGEALVNTVSATATQVPKPATARATTLIDPPPPPRQIAAVPALAGLALPALLAGLCGIAFATQRRRGLRR